MHWAMILTPCPYDPINGEQAHACIGLAAPELLCELKDRVRDVVASFGDAGVGLPSQLTSQPGNADAHARAEAPTARSIVHTHAAEVHVQILYHTLYCTPCSSYSRDLPHLVLYTCVCFATLHTRSVYGCDLCTCNNVDSPLAVWVVWLGFGTDVTGCCVCPVGFAWLRSVCVCVVWVRLGAFGQRRHQTLRSPAAKGVHHVPCGCIWCLEAQTSPDVACSKVCSPCDVCVH